MKAFKANYSKFPFFTFFLIWVADKIIIRNYFILFFKYCFATVKHTRTVESSWLKLEQILHKYAGRAEVENEQKDLSQ